MTTLLFIILYLLAGFSTCEALNIFDNTNDYSFSKLLHAVIFGFIFWPILSIIMIYYHVRYFNLLRKFIKKEKK